MRLVYAIALRLGHASPTRMLAEMRPTEFGMYAALLFPAQSVEPVDDEHLEQDLIAALKAHSDKRS